MGSESFQNSENLIEFSGNQPIKHSDIITICNGEIYNHIKLRLKYGITKDVNDCSMLSEYFNTTAEFGNLQIPKRKGLSISPKSSRSAIDLFASRRKGKKLRNQSGDCDQTSMDSRLFDGPNSIDSALRQLRGVFALISFNKKTGKLIVARDPLGVRPVYYAMENNVLYVASEGKALIDLLSEKNTSIRQLNGGCWLDENMTIHRYYDLPSTPRIILRNQFFHTGHPRGESSLSHGSSSTIHIDIQSQPTSECAELNFQQGGGNLPFPPIFSQSKSTSFSERNTPPSELVSDKSLIDKFTTLCRTRSSSRSCSPLRTLSPLLSDDQESSSRVISQCDNQIFSKIRNLLIESVTIRSKANKEIAVCLSGGLDSSLLASIMARSRCADSVDRSKIKTFSIGFSDSEDMKYARIVADFLDTNHTEIWITHEEALAAIPEVIKMIESYDATTIRASVVMWLLCKYVKENTNCKVLISGEGSDEIFAGYLYFHYAPSHEELFDETRRLTSELPYYDVRRSDGCSAGNSLELRVPFLDVELCDYVLSLSGEIRSPRHRNSNPTEIPDDQPWEKYILRQAFDPSSTDGDVYLPEEVLWRRKVAFSDGVSSDDVPWYMVIQNYVKGLHRIGRLNVLYKKGRKMMVEPSNSSTVSQDFDDEHQEKTVQSPEPDLNQESNTDSVESHLEYYPDATVTSEKLWYRDIFFSEFPSTYKGIFTQWVPRWIDTSGEPSAMVINIGVQDGCQN
ncbi:MAG: hypothetical protein JKX76_01235 [Colwellia sp.]|nr:hypothetical protein [Colwellia sp.]